MSYPDQYGSQARVAADGGDTGPQVGPHKGPTDRRDLAIAIAAVAVVVGVIVVLAVG